MKPNSIWRLVYEMCPDIRNWTLTLLSEVTTYEQHRIYGDSYARHPKRR